MLLGTPWCQGQAHSQWRLTKIACTSATQAALMASQAEQVNGANAKETTACGHQVCDSTAAARLCRVMHMADSSRIVACPGLVPSRIMTQS